MNGEFDTSESLPKKAKLSSYKEKHRLHDITLAANGESIEQESNRILAWITSELEAVKAQYEQLSLECHYLQNGGSLCDLESWARRTSNKTTVRATIPPELLCSIELAASDDQTADSLSRSDTVCEKVENGTVSVPHKKPKRTQGRKSGAAEKQATDESTDRQAASGNQTAKFRRSVSSRDEDRTAEMDGVQEQAVHEVRVLQRVRELRALGIWSPRRLPKVQEPRRPRTHRDMLHEEMAWMATDFEKERKWKQQAARRLAAAISRHFRDADQRDTLASREAEQRARRVASLCARRVREFWNRITTLAEYKRQSFVEEKQKRMLDLQLDFIVSQTERYSSWLSEGLAGQKKSASTRAITSTRSVASLSDGDATMTEQRSNEDADREFEADDAESGDDESSLSEQERTEKRAYDDEVRDLAAEAEESLEELLKRYGQTSPRAAQSESSSQSDSADSETEDEEKQKQKETETEPEVSTSELLADDAVSKPAPAPSNSEVPNNSQPPEAAEQSEAYVDEQAAAAAACQPTGTTLDSTHVRIAVPFLLHGRLREYQHVGLDWLATMYEKKLNGILADEMGLGKTIQTIALLAHLACERGVWGPHLIVVPTSVMLNWRVEFIRWAPAFKLLTYYGSLRERREKRRGWTKTNAFHVCITSYKLAVQDHSVFRRKKWKYLILDEAQHIKNFKSQRWQLLLTLQSQRRLLLTGTPLQNSLLELWSLMHFLMPHLFASHADFADWFVSPLTGMIEGSQEYNEGLVRRLHKVLRPFILRRLKADVEKQMPNKYEHVLMCELSKRQRFLYDDFMAQSQTRDTLASGRLMGVLNVLMQLRKVCNHPNLFEPRPTTFSFVVDPLRVRTHSMLLLAAHQPDSSLPNRAALCRLAENELHFDKYTAARVSQLRTPRKLIEEISADGSPVAPTPLPRCDKPLFPLVPANQSLLTELCRLSEAGFTDVTFVPSSFLPDSDHESTEAADADTEQRRDAAPNLNTSLDTALIDELEQRAAGCSVSQHAAKRDLSLVRDYLLRTNEARCANLTPVYGTSLRRMVTVANPFGVIARLVRLAAASSHQAHAASASGTSFESLFHAFMNDAPPAAVSMTEAFANAPDSCTLRGSVGYVHCLHAAHVSSSDHEAQSDEPHAGEHPPIMHDSEPLCACRARRTWWTETNALCTLIAGSVQRLDELGNKLRRFVFTVPTCMAEPVHVHVAHAPSAWQTEKMLELCVRTLTHRSPSLLGQLASAHRVQFPETRLIQYDCGKLQTLNTLLKQLRTGGHRVLIFTQMSRMLDILEQFLSYQGYVYLRLDGTTRVEQRQILMERFNEDTRIFCFILSTRSGGIGVNLTGADTVIFYDSDWNPSMDAQAQDRCHRIGQTRDVHIYRLISERTIEENILKKANQKRLLNDMAIEHGRFVVASLRQNVIDDLFSEPSGLEELATKERDSDAPTGHIANAPTPALPPVAVSEWQSMPSGNNTEFTQLLCELEDAEDASAAKQAADEQQRELVEFDESVPLDVADRGEQSTGQTNRETDADGVPRDASVAKSDAIRQGPDSSALPDGEAAVDTVKLSKAQLEFKRLTDQLRPIELYALHTVEAQADDQNDEDSEDDFEKAKQDFELSQLIARREEEEMHSALDDEMFFTCERDQLNQVDKHGDDENEADDDSALDNDSDAGEDVSNVKHRRINKAARLNDASALRTARKSLSKRGGGGSGSRLSKWKVEDSSSDVRESTVRDTFGKSRGRGGRMSMYGSTRAKKDADEADSRRSVHRSTSNSADILSSSLNASRSLVKKELSNSPTRGGLDMSTKRSRGRPRKQISPQSGHVQEPSRSPDQVLSARTEGHVADCNNTPQSTVSVAVPSRCTDVVKASFFRRVVGSATSANASTKLGGLQQGTERATAALRNGDAVVNSMQHHVAASRASIGSSHVTSAKPQTGSVLPSPQAKAKPGALENDSVGSALSNRYGSQHSGETWCESAQAQTPTVAVRNVARSAHTKVNGSQ